MEKYLDILKAAFVAFYPEMNEEEWSHIVQNCQSFTLASKHVIIEKGKVQRNLFYLASGLVRGYYINEKGEEITIHFINHKGWITHYSALISNTPSKYIFQALEQSEVIALPFSIVQEGYRKFKGLERFGRLIAESVLQHQQRRIESFQFLTAEQRYLAFIESNPELFNRISISHLCTYLGIQRQSLTRIRKKLASQ